MTIYPWMQTAVEDIINCIEYSIGQRLEFNQALAEQALAKVFYENVPTDIYREPRIQVVEHIGILSVEQKTREALVGALVLWIILWFTLSTWRSYEEFQIIKRAQPAASTEAPSAESYRAF